MAVRLLTRLSGASNVTFATDWAPRKHAPFDLILSACTEQDCKKVIPVLKLVEAELLALRPDSNGMRWIHRNDTVYFHVEKVFDIPYESFVNRVDITHVEEFYKDSLSVDTLVVSRKDSGRVGCQAVHVVELPQPKYAAFMGKDNLDVYKLEKIDYENDQQRVWMLTIHSPNGSAVRDDGYMAFKSHDGGKKTAVSFLACRNFPFPAVLALVGLDWWTWLKNVLTEMAYRRFSNTMMDNIQQCYDGNEYRIGRMNTADE